MFNFEPEPISPESPPVIPPLNPYVYGPDFGESRINLIVKYPKLPTKSSPPFGKALRKFEYEFISHLHESMIVSHSSANPVVSDSAWEEYRSWMNSNISKLKDLGYTLAERKYCSGFVPLTELWKLRNSQLCLPAPEIKEDSLEAMEEEEDALETKPVQHIESAPEPAATSDPQDCVMEESPTQMIVS